MGAGLAVQLVVIGIAWGIMSNNVSDLKENSVSKEKYDQAIIEIEHLKKEGDQRQQTINTLTEQNNELKVESETIKAHVEWLRGYFDPNYRPN